MNANAQLIKINQVKMALDRGYNISNDSEYLNGKKVSFEQIQELNVIYQKDDDPDDKLLVYYMSGNEEKGKKEYTKLVSDNEIENVVVIVENEPKKPFISSPFNIWNIYYVRLLYNPTEHYLVPFHRKLTNEEKNDFYSNTTLKEFQLPILYASDPISMWYGFLPGDVIVTIGKFTVIPKTSPSITYRVVKNILLSLK